MVTASSWQLSGLGRLLTRHCQVTAALTHQHYSPGQKVVLGHHAVLILDFDVIEVGTATGDRLACRAASLLQARRHQQVNDG